ncbi:MAG: hypothetical protein C0483_23680 [Pirellula sp.]|nr:hypothetical protein [Pirellula sp.]
MSDRRNTYRAVLAEAREAELRVGRRCLLVSIVEESAGGLCASAADAPQFASGVEGELTTEDGDCLRVEVMHLENFNGTYRIGMRRLNADLRGRRMRGARSTSPLLLLVGLTIGLYAGFAAQVEPVRDCLATVPTLSRILYRF